MTTNRAFLTCRRKDPGYRPAAERLGDFNAVEQQLSRGDIRAQAGRCMDCGTPFCHSVGCPLGNLIPEFNACVRAERWEDAAHILLSTSSFPEFTGRICPALCESACVLGLNLDAVTIRQLELSIVEKGFERETIRPRPPVERNGMRVAIIGSGPAGLAAADLLNRSGYEVVVYERDRHPGGLLRYGIPDFKLEKWVVTRRVELMGAEGVIFENGVEVGRDLSFRYLKQRFNAVVLACGARRPRDLKIPGRELGGIHFAMEYLVQQNRRIGGEFITPEEEIIATGKRVVVIGGGDTGSDCLGTALRQGAEQVTQLEIMPQPPTERDERQPWPEWPQLLRESSSHQEGGERRWTVMTEAFVGDETHQVRQLRCCEVRWETDDTGQLTRPQKIAGTGFSVSADLVLLATGFDAVDLGLIECDYQVPLNSRGLITVDRANMTAEPGVFAAGDVDEGPSLVVRAIADGRRAALGVMGYLQKR